LHFNLVLDEENQLQAMLYAKHWLASIGIDDACRSGELLFIPQP
jgi:hypothetical protein